MIETKLAVWRKPWLVQNCLDTGMFRIQFFLIPWSFSCVGLWKITCPWEKVMPMMWLMASVLSGAALMWVIYGFRHQKTHLIRFKRSRAG